MKYLIKRNLLVFFRDKVAVFYSLLSVMIIIGLYILFLGDMLVKDLSDIPHARYLMDSWIMAGLIAVTPITTLLGAMGNLIMDKKYKLYKDFFASPVKRSHIAFGYIISSTIVSFILTIFTLILAEIYILIYGGELLNLEAIIKVIGILLLNQAFASFMIFALVSSFKSVNAFSTASTVIGSIIGFLTGIYIPIGSLPKAVQTIIMIFPPSHTGTLLRQVMMKQADELAFANAPQQLVEEFYIQLGVKFKVGDRILSPYVSIIYLAILSIVFLLISLKQIARKER